MKRWTFSAVYMAALAAIGATAGAQQPTGAVGTVVGQVVALDTRAPLTGAQVLVLGTALRAGAGPDGRFVIRNVPAGAQTIRTQLLGFGPKEQPVTVTAGGTVTANFEMKELPYAIAPVVTTALGISRDEKSLGYAT